MNDQSFSDLRNQIRHSVRASKGSLRSNRFDTSDVIQEVMVQIWTDICDSRLRDHVLNNAFVNRMGRGHMAKMRRFHTAQKRAVHKEVYSEGDEQVVNENVPDEQIAKLEQIQRLRDAVKRSLPPVQKYVIYRRFFEEAQFAEIGGDLNRPAQWVRREYLKALKTLKAELGPLQP